MQRSSSRDRGGLHEVFTSEQTLLILHKYLYKYNVDVKLITNSTKNNHIIDYRPSSERKSWHQIDCTAHKTKNIGWRCVHGKDDGISKVESGGRHLKICVHNVLECPYQFYEESKTKTRTRTRTKEKQKSEITKTTTVNYCLRLRYLIKCREQLTIKSIGTLNTKLRQCPANMLYYRLSTICTAVRARLARSHGPVRLLAVQRQGGVLLYKNPPWQRGSAWPR